MNDKSDFATMIAGRLHTAEQSIDDAAADIGLLIHDLTRHRTAAGFAARAGHEALEDTREALNAAVQCRARLVDAHATLARWARHLDVVYVGGPGEGKDQPPGVVTGRLVTS